MILNVWTVTAFFLAGVGALLAAAAAWIAIQGLAGSARAHPERSGAGTNEDRLHLLALVLGVLAGVRLLAWPHFYLLLKSYVPELSSYGVMCAFGVTRIEPELVLAAQWIKPVLLTCLGFWLVHGVAVQRQTTQPYFARYALALLLALLALLDSGVEVTYLTREKIGSPVTCCTQFLDTDAAQGASQPVAALPGLSSVNWSADWRLYAGWNLLLIATCMLLARPRARGVTSPRSGFPSRVIVPSLLALGGLGNLVLTRWIWLEEVAPRVLQLPYHHCVYELLTDVPALGFAAALMVAGNACLLWPLGLPSDSSVTRSIYALCAVALATGLLIVGVHVA